MELLERLRESLLEGKAPFVAFGDWDVEEVAALGELGRSQSFEAGEQLIRAGGKEDRDLFVVLSGELEAYRREGEGERQLSLMRTGDLFGEIAFVDGEPRSASVRALRPSRVRRVSPEDLEALCDSDPGLALRFMRELARLLSFRLRRAGI